MKDTTILVASQHLSRDSVLVQFRRFLTVHNESFVPLDFCDSFCRFIRCNSPIG